ncbi:hypothetical protein GRI40_00095 [Altererythrobacter aerius]|uniref:Uncharacterized protein n=1 Tax=Tsuneonella aeria TaxID=1837929 RepID=A0A6I4TA53_9SPHN|nr:hypothetical protein [Tsuneonella aeria]MXO73624.1 hypothetical protein [Tsuneonella aeria]
MLAELAPARIRRRCAGPTTHLRHALVALADGLGEVTRHGETPWASITFEGARHTVAMRFAGAAAVEAGERLIAALPDHEFAIPGHIVAEATVSAADHRLIPEPVLDATCELLLLKDA